MPFTMSDSCVHGSRYLSLASYHDMPDEDASAAILYDFNMRNVRRGVQLTEPNEHPHDISDWDLDDWLEQWGDYLDDEDDERHWPVAPQRVVTAPSQVAIPEVFTEPFECALPYRIVDSEHVFRWDSAMLDNERIVGVEVSCVFLLC